jgi:hypothetical protein
MSMSPHGEPMYEVVQAGTADSAEPLMLTYDPHGWVRMIGRLSYLHPGTEQKFSFTIYVRKGEPSVRLMVLLSAADLPPQQVDLTATVDVPVSTGSSDRHDT